MSELTVIFSFVLLLLVMILPFAYVVNRRAEEHKERKLELELQIEQAKKGQLGVQTQNFKQMEERLRVLERIATDPSTDISRQIESLREIKAEEEKVT